MRELEQKKPQLDELVKTAENLRESPIRQHIPEKGKLDYSNIHKYYGVNSVRKWILYTIYIIFYEYFEDSEYGVRNPIRRLSPDSQLLHIRNCLKGIPRLH